MSKLWWLLSFLLVAGLYAKGDKVKANLAFLIKDPTSGKICLQQSVGYGHKNTGLIVGTSMSVSDVDKTGVSCVDHDITNTSLIMKDRRRCFDVLTAQFWIGQKQSAASRGFDLTDLQPHNLTCSKAWLQKLLRNENIDFSVHDMWSPVEDIANQAIEKVEKFGDNLVQQITQQLNAIQDTIVKETSVISDTVRRNTDEVIDTLQNNTDVVVDTMKAYTEDVIGNVHKEYAELGRGVHNLESYVMEEEGTMERYLHIIMGKLQTHPQRQVTER